ncbi:MAG TPA: glycosyltransferase family 39 protein [Patescibacteria group bacterium]|nr:glycosyltransferase family 39 protein [Patescibacteria group bacterium]
MNLLRKNKVILIITLIIILGAYLRLYHFSDWLHFELDQSRDAKVIDLALENGASYLPLLGPKAAGTFLRLGPVYYYFSYISAKIFGPTPAGMAGIMPIFGIFSILAFYFLIRRYLGRNKSLALTFLFSVSLYLVMYSRFSWNPNALPLFVIMTFYSLLRAVDTEEKNRGWWLTAGAIFLAITTQMHFLAFVAIPAISVLFLIYKRPRIKLKFWGAAILAFLVLYSPMIVNEFRTGGDNAKEFIDAVTGKSTKSPHVISEKFIKNFYEHSLGYVVIGSGYEEAQSWTIRKAPNEFSFQFLCNEKCKDQLKWGYLGMLFIVFSLLFTLYRFWKEKEQQKKDFLALILLWFVVPYVLFIPLAYDISPRFFLMTSPLPFIFLGIISGFWERLMPKNFGKIITYILILTLSGMNLYFVNQRFSELKKASVEAFEINPDRILKERQRVTLEQQDAIINYIVSVYNDNKYPVYLNSEPFYRRSFLYHIDKFNLPRDDWRNATNAKKVYREGNYFLIFPTLSSYDNDIAKYEAQFDVSGKKQFGTLMLIQLKPKEEAVTDERQIFDEKKSNDTRGVPKRYTWEEIFSDNNDDENATDN